MYVLIPNQNSCIERFFRGAAYLTSAALNTLFDEVLILNVDDPNKVALIYITIAIGAQIRWNNSMHRNASRAKAFAIEQFQNALAKVELVQRGRHSKDMFEV